MGGRSGSKPKVSARTRSPENQATTLNRESFEDFLARKGQDHEARFGSYPAQDLGFFTSFAAHPVMEKDDQKAKATIRQRVHHIWNQYAQATIEFIRPPEFELMDFPYPISHPLLRFAYQEIALIFSDIIEPFMPQIARVGDNPMEMKQLLLEALTQLRKASHDIHAVRPPVEGQVGEILNHMEMQIKLMGTLSSFRNSEPRTR